MRKYIIVIVMVCTTSVLHANIKNDSIKNDSIVLSQLRMTLDSDLEDLFKIPTPQIVQSSPQSHIFEQYVKHPTVEDNGLPNISIPLYEIEVKGLKIPISLSYHASGIKYKQYDGDIGAGWTIMAGGYRISRTIHGSADEIGMYDKDVLNDLSGLVREAYLSTLTEESRMYLPEAFRLLLQEAEISSFLKDSEPDQFTYISPTTQGHFLISDLESRTINLLDQYQDKVEFPQTGPFNDLVLIDNSGNIFKYGSDNKTDKNFQEDSSSSDPTSWMLRKIQTPFNNEINFIYQKNEINESNVRRDRFSINEASKILGSWKDAVHFTANYDYEQNMTPPYKAACFVVEISSNKEIVQFVRDENSNTPYLLKEITVKTK